MKQIPIAVQMYTLRNEGNADFGHTLEKVAELGFQGVEFAGYGNFGVEAVKEKLDQLGLKAASSHVPIQELQDNLSRVISEQLFLGSRHIVCPFVPEELRTEKDYFELIRLLNKVGEQCEKEGISLSYHNHDFELEKLTDGRTVLETILDETNPEWVKAEFDIYWLTYGGEEPVSWLKRYAGRTPLVHLKDMTIAGEKTFAELGTGGVDLKNVLQYGDHADIEWWIVEQDQCKGSPYTSLQKSMDYLKESGNLLK
jgi:sugar phosphate isomerase/epimerase